MNPLTISLFDGLDLIARSALPLFILLAFLTIGVGFWVKIFRKAGYPMWFGIIPFVPLVNLAAWIYFAYTEWPIERKLQDTERELRELKDRFGLNWRE